MWLNFVILVIASLCVGFILGWVVGRPRRWGGFDTPAGPDAADGEDPARVDTLVRRA
jgi:hypothetical protein